MACQGSCGLWHWVAMPPPSTWPWRTFLGMCSGDLSWEPWTEVVQENTRVMWIPYGQQIVDNVHTKCLPQYLPKMLAGSSGSQLFCTGGRLFGGDLWIINIKMLLWFLVCCSYTCHVSRLWSQVQISSTGQGRRRRKPSQLSSGSDRSETRAVAWPEIDEPIWESICPKITKTRKKVKNPNKLKIWLFYWSFRLFLNLLRSLRCWYNLQNSQGGLSWKFFLRFRARHQIPSQAVIRPVAVASHRPDHLTLTNEIYVFRLFVALSLASLLFIPIFAAVLRNLFASTEGQQRTKIILIEPISECNWCW